VRLEGLGNLKQSNDLLGIRTREIPACSLVPQPTVPDHKLMPDKDVQFQIVRAGLTLPLMVT
jgi:hypothetical protein